MKKTLILILVLIPILLHAEYENEYSVVIDSVKYYMATDKFTYVPGDSVDMCYRVTNYKSSPILLYFPSTQEFDFYVMRDTIGVWLWSWGLAFYTIPFDRYLNYEESFEATYSWNMTNYYGNLIAYGDYEVTGYLSTYNNLPLSVDIEYIPAGTDDPTMSSENLTLISTPNPFKSSTNISFSISKNQHVMMDLYNLKGQKIKTLTNEKYSKGEHTVSWNGCDENGTKVSPGVYFFKLECDGEVAIVKKCMVL